MSNISAQGGEIIYVKMDNNVLSYSHDDITYTQFGNAPYTIDNTDTSLGNVIVKFIGTINITSSDQYFICGTSHIQFGSLSVETNGSIPIIIIKTTSLISNSQKWRGFIENGTSTTSGRSNITIANLLFQLETTTSSTVFLDSNGAIVARDYFGKSATKNNIINCQVYGDLKYTSTNANDGFAGIVGANAGDSSGNLSIYGCSFNGDFKSSNCGGIAGQNCGSNSGSVYIKSCWVNINNITDKSGGITNSENENVYILNCYVIAINIGGTGSISAGGLVGNNCGIGQDGCTISNSYCKFNSLDGYGGGICGKISGTSLLNAQITSTINITNCYVKGGMINSNCGGICGNITATSGNIRITNCYNAAETSIQEGFIISRKGASVTDQDSTNSVWSFNNCYAEYFGATSFTWNNTNAVATLTGTPSSPLTNPVGLTWFYDSNNSDSGFRLIDMGYTAYNRNNINITDTNVLIHDLLLTNLNIDYTNTKLKINGLSNGIFSILYVENSQTNISETTGIFSINAASGNILFDKTKITASNTYNVYVLSLDFQPKTNGYNITVLTIPINYNSLFPPSVVSSKTKVTKQQTKPNDFATTSLRQHRSLCGTTSNSYASVIIGSTSGKASIKRILNYSNNDIYNIRNLALFNFKK